MLDKPVEYKKNNAFTVRCTNRLKQIIMKETARINNIGGRQVTQTDFINELIEEALAARGLMNTREAT